MIKVGDTVRYLDAVGGGIVTKFQTKDLILVLEPDGFETPILVREVVAVGSTNAYNFSKEETKSVKTTHIISNVEELGEEPELTIPPYQFNERDVSSEGGT